MGKYNLNGMAGLVAETTSAAGLTMRLYHAPTVGLDTAGGWWAMSCEAHGTVCNQRTRAQAEERLADADWCERCQAGETMTLSVALYGPNDQDARQPHEAVTTLNGERVTVYVGQTGNLYITENGYRRYGKANTHENVLQVCQALLISAADRVWGRLED